MAKKAQKKATKRTAKKTTSKRTRKAAKRDLVRAPNATFFAKRDEEGEFTEMDERDPSLAADRRVRAKRTVASGYGDQGDRPRRKRTAKKR